MRNIIKGILLALVGGTVLFSCSSPDKVSAWDIVGQVNKQLKNQAAQQYFVNLQVGTYELNNASSRLSLRQLEAAGLVTYKVTRYPWWEKELKNYRQPYNVVRYYWGYQYYETEYRTVKKNVYSFEDHYVVSVALTKKGEQQIAEEVPEPVEDVDKDMLQPEIDESKYAWNKKDLSENWPDIPNPFLEPEEPAVPEYIDEPSESRSHSSRSSRSSSAEKKDPIVRIDSLKYRAYTDFTPSSEFKCLKGYSIKAIKARNIQIAQVDGRPVATAEVILKSYGTTDAARIIKHTENGYKYLLPVQLVYYLDKGWVLEDVDFSPIAARDSGREYGVDGDYPEGSIRYLKPSDLTGKTPEQLKIMRNEIYARHHLIFKSRDLIEHFANQDWYRGTTSDAKAVAKNFSDIERKNVEMIKRYEK